MNIKTWIILTLLLLVASAAAAQAPQKAPAIELTPFAGFQFGGWFSEEFGYNSGLDDIDIDESATWGLILDVAVNRHAQIELLYSRQETEFHPPRFSGGPRSDLDIEYFQLGFLWQWTPGQVRPFVVGSLGAASFDPERGGSETRFATTVGGGVKLVVNDHFGFRFEGRAYTTFMEHDDVVFCDPSYCHYHRDGSVLVQFDLKAGLVFSF